ncbi:MAG: cupin domain-containing protein [Candidatus Caldarchaeum sp.]
MAVRKVSNSTGDRKELQGGSFLIELLTQKTVGSKKAMLGISVFKPGFRTKNIVHSEEELAYVLKGKGKIITADGVLEVNEGEALYIPAGAPHIVWNDSDSEVIMVYVFTYPEYPPTQVLD